MQTGTRGELKCYHDSEKGVQQQYWHPAAWCNTKTV